ncbi:MAG: SPFH/Band 7/PHB domain protein, partial [Planctomycetaceae bacterium]
MNAVLAFFIVFFLSFLIVPVILSVGRLLGVYTIVSERRYHVYVLFGEVVATIDEPGLHFLWPLMGWKALIVNTFG